MAKRRKPASDDLDGVIERAEDPADLVRQITELTSRLNEFRISARDRATLYHALAWAQDYPSLRNRYSTLAGRFAFANLALSKSPDNPLDYRQRCEKFVRRMRGRTPRAGRSSAYSKSWALEYQMLTAADPEERALLERRWDECGVEPPPEVGRSRVIDRALTPQEALRAITRLGNFPSDAACRKWLQRHNVKGLPPNYPSA